MANISKENQILNQIFEAEILNLIFHMRQFKNNIKMTDIIRLLAHLSSHPSFKPQIFSEEYYIDIIIGFIPTYLITCRQLRYKMQLILKCITQY